MFLHDKIFRVVPDPRFYIRNRIGKGMRKKPYQDFWAEIGGCWKPGNPEDA